ncbi:hypothetical protein ASF92_10195 [Pedobacter sp. Leaf176]|nr:hypothetical protein ASF92_10195 [Pedobacter sp. Leaf176]
MPASLFKNLMIVYKPVLLWNVLVSLLIGLFFVVDGYDKPGGYAMTIFMKPIGWFFSIIIERFFLQKHRYFYKNMGLGFRKILGNIILYDIAILLLIITTTLLCRNFLLTVLPSNLIKGQY